MEEKIIILENDKVIVERIISNGAITDIDYWYDQEVDELVTITRGNAILELVDKKINLAVNESYYIEKHIKHKVAYSSSDCEWICVYFKNIN